MTFGLFIHCREEHTFRMVIDPKESIGELLKWILTDFESLYPYATPLTVPIRIQQKIVQPGQDAFYVDVPFRLTIEDIFQHNEFVFVKDVPTTTLALPQAPEEVTSKRKVVPSTNTGKVPKKALLGLANSGNTVNQRDTDRETPEEIAQVDAMENDRESPESDDENQGIDKRVKVPNTTKETTKAKRKVSIGASFSQTHDERKKSENRKQASKQKKTANTVETEVRSASAKTPSRSHRPQSQSTGKRKTRGNSQVSKESTAHALNKSKANTTTKKKVQSRTKSKKDKSIQESGDDNGLPPGKKSLLPDEFEVTLHKDKGGIGLAFEVDKANENWTGNFKFRKSSNGAILPAEKSGKINCTDVITGINGTDIKSIDDFRANIHHLSSSFPVTLTFRRGKASIPTTATSETRDEKQDHNDTKKSKAATPTVSSIAKKDDQKQGNAIDSSANILMMLSKSNEAQTPETVAVEKDSRTRSNRRKSYTEVISDISDFEDNLPIFAEFRGPKKQSKKGKKKISSSVAQDNKKSAETSKSTPASTKSPEKEKKGTPPASPKGPTEESDEQKENELFLHALDMAEAAAQKDCHNDEKSREEATNEVAEDMVDKENDSMQSNVPKADKSPTNSRAILPVGSSIVTSYNKSTEVSQSPEKRVSESSSNEESSQQSSQNTRSSSRPPKNNMENSGSALERADSSSDSSVEETELGNQTMENSEEEELTQLESQNELKPSQESKKSYQTQLQSSESPISNLESMLPPASDSSSGSEDEDYSQSALDSLSQRESSVPKKPSACFLPGKTPPMKSKGRVTTPFASMSRKKKLRTFS